MIWKELPYITDIQKELFETYLKNGDVAGLSILLVIFQAGLLNYIIKDLKDLYEEKTLNHGSKWLYLKVLWEKYQKFLGAI